MMSEPAGVLAYWFHELSEADWFTRNDKVDADIANRFGDVHRQACAGELASWRTELSGALAEVIVLDQFSRNIYRDDPRAFAQDTVALVLAQVAIDRFDSQALPPRERAFLYMPFMHSESMSIHDRAVVLFSEPGMESNYDFEMQHKAIIDRFGRYPHRNTLLGRQSTPEELAFLREEGSSF